MQREKLIYLDEYYQDTRRECKLMALWYPTPRDDELIHEVDDIIDLLALIDDVYDAYKTHGRYTMFYRVYRMARSAQGDRIHDPQALLLWHLRRTHDRR